VLYYLAVRRCFAGGALLLAATMLAPGLQAQEAASDGEANNGSIVFKVENRHAYTDLAPSAFGGELGYVGLANTVFSDQGWRTTHLFWQ
jgi:hypothetical protein